MAVEAMKCAFLGFGFCECFFFFFFFLIPLKFTQSAVIDVLKTVFALERGEQGI